MVEEIKNLVSIPRWACGFLADKDLAQIEEAVRNAEGVTSGEIVPMLVRSSGHETTARRLLTTYVVIFILVLSPWWRHFFGSHEYLYLCEGLTAIWLLILARLVPIPGNDLRFLLPVGEQIHQVDVRAELEFYRIGIQNTVGHTGILLFVSLAERRAVVLADKSISEKLPQETWTEVLNLMLSGFKSNHVGQGYADAIKRCAEILSVHFPRQTDDKDELGNTLVIKD